MKHTSTVQQILQQMLTMGRVSRGVALIAVCIIVCGARWAPAQDALHEYKLKAAFLPHFLQHVDWLPRSSGTHPTIILGVLGESPFGTALNTIDGLMIKDKGLTIKQCQSLADVRDCDVLFICSSERERLIQIKQTLKGLNILTVGEMKQFAKQGGVIGFIIKKGKVRFEINIRAAARAKLRIGEKLLDLATNVYRRELICFRYPPSTERQPIAQSHSRPHSSLQAPYAE